MKRFKVLLMCLLVVGLGFIMAGCKKELTKEEQLAYLLEPSQKEVITQNYSFRFIDSQGNVRFDFKVDNNKWRVMIEADYGYFDVTDKENILAYFKIDGEWIKTPDFGATFAYRAYGSVLTSLENDYFSYLEEEDYFIMDSNVIVEYGKNVLGTDVTVTSLKLFLTDQQISKLVLDFEITNSDGSIIIDTFTVEFYDYNLTSVTLPEATLIA